MAALQLNEKEIKDIFIHKVSVDARGIIKFVYSVAVVLADETQEMGFVEKSKDITVKKQSPLVVAKGEKPLEKPPVICGFG
ncbi:MAG: hypothetical protein RSE24_05850, partial [Oscillospiraceae bacterium]